MINYLTYFRLIKFKVFDEVSVWDHIVVQGTETGILLLRANMMCKWGSI